VWLGVGVLGWRLFSWRRFCVDAPQGHGMPMDKAAAYEAKMLAIRNAQVVCATCVGAGSGVLERFRFTRVLIDEATQATEPSTIVPLCLGAEQVVLVGDHCQLPPTVVSESAEACGLTKPLFSRLVDCGVRPFLLDTQCVWRPCDVMCVVACELGFLNHVDHVA